VVVGRDLSLKSDELESGLSPLLAAFFNLHHSQSLSTASSVGRRLNMISKGLGRKCRRLVSDVVAFAWRD
jgi:hypothetical protein